MDHVVQIGDGAIAVTNHREVDRGALSFGDVVFPFDMAVNRVDGQADDFHISSVEFWLEASDGSEFCRADGSEIFRVREQHSP